MRLENMNQNEIKTFSDKISIKELNNIFAILADYEKYNRGSLVYFNFKKYMEENIDINLCTEDDYILLDLYEFKELFKKLDFGELISIHNMINNIYFLSMDENYKILYELIYSLLKEQKDFIINNKKLENMDKDEMLYYMSSISTSALDNYGIQIDSKKDIPTVDEMYDFYNNRDIRNRKLVNRCVKILKL